jgi:hypothetical protein
MTKNRMAPSTRHRGIAVDGKARPQRLMALCGDWMTYWGRAFTTPTQGLNSDSIVLKSLAIAQIIELCQ